MGDGAYHLSTSRGQKVEIYIDRPMPVDFVVELTQAIDRLLTKRGEITTLTVRLSCEMGPAVEEPDDCRTGNCEHVRHRKRPPARQG